MTDNGYLMEIQRRVGTHIQYIMHDDRCVALDLTSSDFVYHGLIRQHSAAEKQEILQLVSRLTALKKLNLRRNRLFHLPDSFAGLEQLEELNLGSNYVGASVKAVATCRKLKYLNLGNNDLDAVPRFVGSFSDLEYLSLHKNLRINRLDDSLSNLKNLKTLNLYFVNIRKLPQFVFRLENLTSLTLWNCVLPEDLALLRNLELFTDCGAMNMTALPGSFTTMHKLRMARLYHNSLRALPADFGELRQLEQLSLYQNKLSSLPESCARLQKLRKLNLGWNLFESVPSCLAGVQSLEWLGIFENPLKSLDLSRLPPKARLERVWPFTSLK